jgi:hypothetical protein
MIYIRVLLHLVFVFGLLFIWQRIDKKQDYKSYLKVSLILGIPLGLGFDLFGVVLFKLWRYTSCNIFEYIAILFGTYVVITPVVIEVYNFIDSISDRLLKIELINTLSRYFHTLLLVISIISLILLSYHRIQTKNSPAPPSLFFLMFFSLVLFSNALLGILGEEGAITKFLKGHLLSPLAIIFSGIISGLIWEVFNSYVRLWTYESLPIGELLNVPMYAILLWGTINLAYITAGKIAKKLGVLN